MRSIFVFITALCTPLLLPGCSDAIWNAGDLAEWVRDRAEEQGCVRESIELEDWYREEPSGNNWHGVCTDAVTGNRKAFSIDVDPVWTPSG